VTYVTLASTSARSSIATIPRGSAACACASRGSSSRGRPDGRAEVPEPVRGLSKEDVPKVRVFETGRFLLVFDDREGKEALVIKDKRSADQIEFDGAGMGITIKATSALLLKADGLVSIEGASVQINGRLVLPTPKAI
jgi:hypothetical protein